MTQREQLVHDEVESCPYLEGQHARMPLRWQLERLSPAEVDASLARGDRRIGRMLYHTACPSCMACEPLRIPVESFQPTRSQRRVWRRNADVRVDVGPAVFTEEKLALYNRHKLERGLSKHERPMGERGYCGWFTETCMRTVEMRYTVGDRLVGVGILDVGERDTSSVYYFFDPDEAWRSLGVFSVMVELAWLLERGGRYHYLGLFVDGCQHLQYKATWFVHERLVDGQWRRFERPGAVT